MLFPNLISCKNLAKEQLEALRALPKFDKVKKGIELNIKIIMKIICPQFTYCLANKLLWVLFSEKNAFPNIKDIINPIQNILKISTPLLKIYFSVTLNKYFSEGFDSKVRSSSVKNLYKSDTMVEFFSSFIL